MSVREVIICDSKGAIHAGREDLSPEKRELLDYSNPHGRSDNLKEIIRGVDVFIGVSKGNLLVEEDIRSMAPDPIVLAMANPDPEIMPDEATRGGAAIVGTGRSDFPNQVNNVLAFPGIFRGAIDAGATRITEAMKIAAAYALASAVEEPCAEYILPDALDPSVAPRVARAVAEAWNKLPNPTRK